MTMKFTFIIALSLTALQGSACLAQEDFDLTGSGNIKINDPAGYVDISGHGSADIPIRDLDLLQGGGGKGGNPLLGLERGIEADLRGAGAGKGGNPFLGLERGLEADIAKSGFSIPGMGGGAAGHGAAPGATAHRAARP